MAATIDPIMTLGIIKKITEIKLLSDGGDPRIVNIPKPITAINPPRNPPIIPHLNRLFNLSKRICFIISKNRSLSDEAVYKANPGQTIRRSTMSCYALLCFTMFPLQDAFRTLDWGAIKEELKELYPLVIEVGRC